MEQERAGTSWALLQQRPRLASVPGTHCPCPLATMYLIPCFKEVLSFQNPSSYLSHEAPRSKGTVLYGCNCESVSQDTVRLLLSVQGALGMLRNHHSLQGEAKVISQSSCFLTGPRQEELVIVYSGRLQEQGGIYRDQTHAQYAVQTTSLPSE